VNAATAGLARVRVDADLTVEIDGLPARVTSQGDAVQVVTDRPLALVRRIGTTSVPRPVRESVLEWCRHLAEHGVRLELWGPRGLVGAVGSPSTSSPGRGIRDWRVETGPARVIAAEIAQEAGEAARRRRGAIVSVLMAVALVVGFRMIRRRLRGR
jgi:hypothetical protein